MLRRGAGDVRKCRAGKEESVRKMGRTVSRKDFLRLGGGGLAAAALLGSAGCGGAQGGGEVIRYLTETPETTTLERAAIEIQVNRFQDQNPKYTLERESIAPDDLLTVIKTRLQSGKPPDVFNYGTGPGFAGVLEDAGLLRSLEKAYEENGWEIYDWARQQVTYNGTVYGVPDLLQEIIVFYNKDLVPEPPKTVDELREIADDLKGQGKIPFAFGDSEQWPAGHLFSMAASNLLGQEGLNNILNGDGRWNVPEVEKAIDLMFREFVESGYYPEGVNAITYDDANSLFYAGKAAMLPTGTWQISAIIETVQDFEVDFFPFPSIDGSTVAPAAGTGTGLFVAKDAKEPQGAITFIDYLLQDSTARLLTEELLVIPAHPFNQEGLDVPGLFRVVLEDMSKATRAGALGYNIDVLTPQSFNEVMWTGFQEVLNGTTSPGEQAAALQDAWAKAKKQGKPAA
jgi:raffinose/stachyose/melibiose transport system substrate-binding protein